MKKNRILSMMLISIFMAFAFVIPVRANGSLAFLLNVNIYESVSLFLHSLFFGDYGDQEGEINGVKVKVVSGDIRNQEDVDAIVDPYQSIWFDGCDISKEEKKLENITIWS